MDDETFSTEAPPPPLPPPPPPPAPTDVTPLPPPRPAPVLGPWPPVTEPGSGSRRIRGGVRRFIPAALVGGLVGALAATAVVYTVDRPPATVVGATSGVQRPSHTIAATSGDVASIVAKVEPAVVAITTGSASTNGGDAGTGFVITADGFIVTNNHVVEGASSITVDLADGTRLRARLVGREATSDLAVLKVDATGLPVVETAGTDGVQVGDEVVAIGNALALDGGLSVTRGIVSGLHRTVNTDVGSTLVGMLQTDAAINPGNSGGPPVDAAGRVIGINTAIANPQSANNVGFAIPWSNAQPVVEDLRLGRPAAFLGVVTTTVTPALVRSQSLAVTSGALVTKVASGSAAADAGIRTGDVIVSVAGRSVADTSGVQAVVRSRRPGDTVTVVVNRAGAERSFDARLTERPSS